MLRFRASLRGFGSSLRLSPLLFGDEVPPYFPFLYNAMDCSLSEEEAGLQLRDQRGAAVDPSLAVPVAKAGPLADGKSVLLPESSDLPSVASKRASGSGEQVLGSQPAKAGNSSAKAEAEEIQDSPPPSRGRSRGQKVRSPSQKVRDASPSGGKRRKKQKRKRSRSASSRPAPGPEGAEERQPRRQMNF
jgi:hypothetical protein